MKITEFRKLIREEVRKVMKEGPYNLTGKYFYIYFNGKDAVQGESMNNKKDLLKLGMEPDDVKNVGPVYTVKVDSYLVNVITSATDKKSIWCVVTPGDAKFAKDDEYSYNVCMKAINKAKSGNGTEMTFKDFLSRNY